MIFTDEDYWKAIILFGLNTASYKIALAHVLLEHAHLGNTSIDWQSLSEGFLDQYLKRLDRPDAMPQQAFSGRLTKIERIVLDLNAGRISSKQQAVTRVGDEAFGDVVPRFQTVGQDKALIGERFYEARFGQSLMLKDELLNVANGNLKALTDELDARWSLLEGSFLIRHENWALTNDLRETYLKKGTARRDLTPNIPFLRGYQGDTCFYCGHVINDDKIHVDHVLPRQVVRHDEIWNLVLAHDICNYDKRDRLVANHFIEKLAARNENIMGSSHPWKRQIELHLGPTAYRRRATLRDHYEAVSKILGRDYWGGSSSYNPAADPFFARLITQMNADRA